ncbi:MAG: Tim44-like domain-containing protein [Burkholderiaceae bacterium]|nr:Tim44-like domain-containing protein [Burkholderiaceae bacterium]
MKKFLIAMMLIASSLSVIATDAQAARLGGGRSFGKQSPTVTRQAPMQKQAAPAQQAQPTAGQTPAPAAPAVKPPSPWRGILGGALLGLGLGALLSHFGLGGAAASIISTILMVALIGFALMFVFRLLTRKKDEPGRQDAYASGYQTGYSSPSVGSSTPEIGSGLGSQAAQPAAYQADAAASSATYMPYGVPSDFDVPAFLRSAKTYFIRLQASWDKADIYDIREYTTPEMYAELKMQMQERGASQNVTDVITLDAALLGIENIGSEQMASVQFSGTIKESPDAPATEFYEVWNLTRPLTGKGGWVLAGIQQVN